MDTASPRGDGVMASLIAWTWVYATRSAGLRFGKFAMKDRKVTQELRRLTRGFLFADLSCKPLALGQVLSRMKLDWSGSPLSGRVAVMSAFKVMLLTFIVYNLIDLTLYYITYPYVTAQYNAETEVYTMPDDVPSWVAPLDTTRESLSLLYSIFVLIVMIRTRSHIRNKYQIPEQTCSGCEDCCCSFWCSACTICQMARHTADYKTYKASCCSETGLEPMAPDVV